jgi:hypothetical protein
MAVKVRVLCRMVVLGLVCLAPFAAAAPTAASITQLPGIRVVTDAANAAIEEAGAALGPSAQGGKKPSILVTMCPFVTPTYTHTVCTAADKITSDQNRLGH